MPLNDIVDVVITRQTQTVTEVGFGIPLILGTNVNFTELIKFYSDLDEVRTDFSPSDKEYIAAQDIFSQEIAPKQIAIGRRQVDTVNVNVETAMTGEDYTVNVNGQEITITSSSATSYSIVNLDADLIPLNRIALAINGTGLGTVTSIIDFAGDFVTGNTIQPIVNGVSLPAPIVFTTDQATTIGLVATKIGTAAGTPVATVTGPRQITVVFAAPGTNTVNGFNLAGTMPYTTYDISQGSFLFATDTDTTMNNIASAIELAYPTFTATISGVNSRTLTVQGPANTNVVVNSFVVTGGTSQAVATITQAPQTVSASYVSDALVTAINAAVGYPVTAADLTNGLFSLTTDTPGVPFTLKLETSIENPNQANVLITQVEPGTLYQVRINGIPFNYTSDENVQSASEIASELTDFINATIQDPENPLTNVPVTATNLGNGKIQLIADNIDTAFSLSVTPSIMAINKGLVLQPLVAANPVADDLTDINNENDTWYALISVDRTLQTVKDIAEWTEAHIKLFGTASSDPNIINSPAGTDITSIAAWANQRGYIRTFVMYHQDADYDYPEAAWFGRVLPLEPGSETWKFKTLNGISRSNLTTTQQNTALAKQANIYTFVAGVGITANGTVAQGEFIDVIRGVDWLRARIQEFVFGILVRNPKVPYTDAGIAAVQSEVMRALALGVSNQFLSNDPAPLVTVPRAADVSPSDKAARILRDVVFVATLAGAIHAVVIRGSVEV